MRRSVRHAIVLIVCLTLLILPAAAETSIVAGKEAYTKGELMQLSGSTSLAGALVTVQGMLGTAIVFEKDALMGTDGTFTLTVPLLFTYPKGRWSLRATATAGDISESAEASVEVTPSAEAARFLVTMLSPVEGDYHRTESIEISVSVSTAGAPVEGATATTWGHDGAELAMNEVEGGVYSVTVPLGHDAPVGDWTIPVTVTKPLDPTDPSQGLLGGCNSLTVKIEKTPLTVKFLEPKVSRFFIEEEVPIKVEVKYENGQAIASPTVKVTLKETLDLKLIRNADGTFSGTYTTTPDDEGLISISAHCHDDADNSGQASTSVTVGGKVQWLARKYLPYAAIIVIAALVLYKVTRSGLSARAGRQAIEKEYIDTVTKLRKLQSDYFEKNIIDRTTFDKKTVEYETAAAKLKGRLMKFGVDADELLDKEEEE